MQVVIRLDQGNESTYGSVLKYTQLFSLWVTHCGKRALKKELNYWNQTFYIVV